MGTDGLDRHACKEDKAELEDRLDLRGLKCPLPVLRTKKALGRRAPGARLVVLADDPLARLDLLHLCRSEGHEAEPPAPLSGGGWRFSIRKGLGAADQ